MAAPTGPVTDRTDLARGAATAPGARTSVRCAPVDRAPLPPHERPWRHPSELGPPEHEPTSTGGRVLIVASATVSLLLIGLLALSMTPPRGTPVAEASTSTATTVEPTARPVALDRPPVPVVTPLGDDGWGITTAAGAGARTGRMAARLPSGDVIDVHVVRHDEDSGVTLVSLPTRPDGYELADEPPTPTDTVVVQAGEPIVVTLREIATLEVDEGTPVLDAEGDLVGLCTWADGVLAVMTVTTMPEDPTGDVTAPATTTTVAVTVVTTLPPAGSVPTSDAPSTTAGSLPTTTTAAATSPSTGSRPTTTTPSTPNVSAGGAATSAPG